MRMSKQQHGSSRISFSANTTRVRSRQLVKLQWREGGGTSRDAAEGADVDAAGDADAKDGALALRQRESVGRERRAGGAKACAGTTVVPQNMSLLSTSMEEVVELKAHLRTPHTSQHARDMGDKFERSKHANAATSHAPTRRCWGRFLLAKCIWSGGRGGNVGCP